MRALPVSWGTLRSGQRSEGVALRRLRDFPGPGEGPTASVVPRARASVHESRDWHDVGPGSGRGAEEASRLDARIRYLSRDVIVRAGSGDDSLRRRIDELRARVLAHLRTTSNRPEDQRWAVDAIKRLDDQKQLLGFALDSVSEGGASESAAAIERSVEARKRRERRPSRRAAVKPPCVEALENGELSQLLDRISQLQAEFDAVASTVHARMRDASGRTKGVLRNIFSAVNGFSSAFGTATSNAYVERLGEGCSSSTRPS